MPKFKRRRPEPRPQTPIEVFPLYAVMLDRWGHDSNGNPIAHHTVFAYRSADQDLTRPSARMYETRRRMQVGYSDARKDSAPDALRRAEVSGVQFESYTGSRSEGVMWLLYKPVTPETATS